MPRILALEWDSREIRVVVAQRRRTDVALEQAFAVELPSAESGTEHDFGRALSEALSGRGLGNTETLVAIGRANVELRPLSLPPAPPDELPDLVRFQALKQFTSLGDDWPLDFVPLTREGQTNVTVLAAAIAPDLVKQIQAACGGVELKPTRIVLRPFAAAALLRRRRSTDGCLLLVDVRADEADLSVIKQGNVEFIRTVRLGAHGDPDEIVRVMMSEVRRTIAAASNQLPGTNVDEVVLCGDSSEFAQLKGQLEQQANLKVEYFDPFEGLTLASDAQAVRPPHVGRFAPLLGALVSEAAGAAHDVDFLNPRRRPPPPNQRRRNALLAAAGSVVVLGIAWYYWSAYSELESRVSALQADLKGLQDTSKRLEPVRVRATEVDEFVAGDVFWLDELRRLSEKYLPPDDAIVGQLSFNPATRGVGVGSISLDGHVRSSAHLVQLESRLRDEHHKVAAGSGRADDKQPRLPWRFEGTITVTGDEDAAAATTTAPRAKPTSGKAAP